MRWRSWINKRPRESESEVGKKGDTEMVKKSGQMGVPVVDIDGDVVVGFDQNLLKEKLGI